MTEVENIYTVSAVRTAAGKYDGSLRSVPIHTMGTPVTQGAVRRTGINKEQIDEVILGKMRQGTEASSAVRCAAPEADLSENVPGFTMNHLCASAVQTLLSGCQEIWCSEADVIVADDTENISCVPHHLRHEHQGDGPLTLVDSDIGAGTTAQPASIHGTALGVPRTAENVAERFHITREEQDRFAVEGQRRAATVIAAGYFKEEVLPVETREEKRNFVFDTDEFPRPSTIVEVLATLRSVVKPDGTVTAGSSCGLNGSASALVLMSGREMEESGLRPLVRIVGITRAALDPAIMGYGPVYVTRKIMKHTGMTVGQMDLAELNEAFTPQAVACMWGPGLDPEKVNIDDGTTALGHPLDSTGTRLVVTLLHNLMCTDDWYGLAALCIGGGQSMATVIEKL